MQADKQEAIKALLDDFGLPTEPLDPSLLVRPLKCIRQPAVVAEFDLSPAYAKHHSVL
jgi:hypothetical protein